MSLLRSCAVIAMSFLEILNISIQATTPVAVLLATWGLGVEPVNLKKLTNVSFIVIGVIIACFGEIEFVLIGFIYQAGGIVFEAVRLVMVQRLLSSAEFKMDPLVSLYYFAPVCAIMNSLVSLIFEVPKMSMADIYNVGVMTLTLNAFIAFMLNVSVVFLVRFMNLIFDTLLCIRMSLGSNASKQIGKTSSLVLTLSGVLKDILLVIASMFIFRNPVSLLQAFGYSIALAGLVYYKLGADKLKEYIGQGQRVWAEYGARNPVRRKVISFAIGCLLLIILMSGLAPSVAPDYDPSKYAKSQLDYYLGEKGTQVRGQ